MKETLKLILNIVYTLFYVLGYGCFFVVALDIETMFQKLYYAFMAPFLIVLLVLILLQIYLIWK